jgi:hypothetical protein
MRLYIDAMGKTRLFCPRKQHNLSLKAVRGSAPPWTPDSQLPHSSHVEQHTISSTINHHEVVDKYEQNE